MSAAALAFTAAALAMPGHAAAGAAATTVTMPGKYFAPADLTVVVGDTVTWRNDDAGAHSVSADDGSFSSPSLSTGATFQATFDAPGRHTYFCTIHRQMRGTITVAALGLSGPGAPVTAGGDAMLDVVAPAGTRDVTLERLTASGAEPVAETAPGADGRGTFHVMVDEPGRYRARAGDRTSRVVRVAVAPRVTVRARRVGRRVLVRASIAPALPGARVELERYVRERFDYRPLRSVRSVDGTAAAFRFSTTARTALRAAVVRAPGGWSPGHSAHVVVRGLKAR